MDIMDENDIKSEAALYFETPAQAVETISRLLVASDWKKLSAYYDLSDSGVKREELESGRFFKYKEAPLGPHFMRQVAIKHPFSPGYEYERHSHEGGGKIRVYLVMEIDQGGGMIQKSLAAFMMIETDGGYQILPERVSYFDEKYLDNR